MGFAFTYNIPWDVCSHGMTLKVSDLQRICSLEPNFDLF